MKTRLGIRLLVAAWLAAPAAAPAATLTTTFVYSPAGSNINCNLVNAGKKPLQVTMRIRDLAGAILSESGQFTIGPQEGNGIGDGGDDDYYGYCEFEIKGSRKAARASLQLKASGANGPTVVVPAQ
jgi:hypothetical protein